MGLAFDISMISVFNDKAGFSMRSLSSKIGLTRFD